MAEIRIGLYVKNFYIFNIIFIVGNILIFYAPIGPEKIRIPFQGYATRLIHLLIPCHRKTQEAAVPTPHCRSTILDFQTTCASALGSAYAFSCTSPHSLLLPSLNVVY